MRNVLCYLDVHLRRWQESLDWGGTRCIRCGATWPYRVYTTEELFPGFRRGEMMPRLSIDALVAAAAYEPPPLEEDPAWALLQDDQNE